MNTHTQLITPEGRAGMSDVFLLSGISGLSFDSPFLSPLLFFSAQSFCSFCLVIFLLIVHSPDIFLQKILKQVSLRVRLFVWLLYDNQWVYVQHRYLPLCVYITFKTSHCFCPVIFIIFFNLASINQTQWSTIAANPNLMCSFNRGNI